MFIKTQEDPDLFDRHCQVFGEPSKYSSISSIISPQLAALKYLFAIDIHYRPNLQ